jgi:hypothetical protein
MNNELNIITNLKTTIENKIGKSVQFYKTNDNVNLLYTAKINGLTIANVYKSFDKNFNQIEIIRYVNLD